MCDQEKQKRSEVFERWIHEDNFINHRLTWLLTSQAIIFSAYGLVLKFGGEDICCESNKFHYVLNVIPVPGIVTSILILLGISAAAYVIFKFWQNDPEKNQESSNENSHELYTEVVNKFTLSGGLVPPLLLPLCFTLAWGYIVFKTECY